MGCRDGFHGRGSEAAGEFQTLGVVEKIECPFLMVHGEEDAQVSLADARTCFNAVGSKDKTLRVFTAEEGGSSIVRMTAWRSHSVHARLAGRETESVA